MQDLGHVFLDHNGKTWYASFFMKGLKIALYTRMELIYAVTKSQRKNSILCVHLKHNMLCHRECLP